MGVFYILGGLAILMALIFLLTKNYKAYAIYSFIPLFVIVLIFALNEKETQYDEFFEEYNVYKHISIEQIDDYIDYEIVKKQEKINKELKEYKNLCNSWFQGELFDKRFLQLEPIEINLKKDFHK